jgi:hypothetical protein
MSKLWISNLLIPLKCTYMPQTKISEIKLSFQNLFYTMNMHKFKTDEHTFSLFYLIKQDNLSLQINLVGIKMFHFFI